MVRVPKLPLSMTASANSAPSMGVPVDPVTGYPYLTVWRLRGASFRGAGLRSRPADDCDGSSESDYRGPVVLPPRASRRLVRLWCFCLQLWCFPRLGADTPGAAPRNRVAAPRDVIGEGRAARSGTGSG